MIYKTDGDTGDAHSALLVQVVLLLNLLSSSRLQVVTQLWARKKLAQKAAGSDDDACLSNFVQESHFNPDITSSSTFRRQSVLVPFAGCPAQRHFLALVLLLVWLGRLRRLLQVEQQPIYKQEGTPSECVFSSYLHTYTNNFCFANLQWLYHSFAFNHWQFLLSTCTMTAMVINDPQMVATNKNEPGLEV